MRLGWRVGGVVSRIHIACRAAKSLVLHTGRGIALSADFFLLYNQSECVKYQCDA